MRLTIAMLVARTILVAAVDAEPEVLPSGNNQMRSVTLPKEPVALVHHDGTHAEQVHVAVVEWKGFGNSETPLYTSTEN